MSEGSNSWRGHHVRRKHGGKLRDPNTYFSVGYPDFTLATMTAGYIFLVPFRKFQSVTVDDKFITTANLQEVPTSGTLSYAKRLRLPRTCSN